MSAKKIVNLIIIGTLCLIGLVAFSIYRGIKNYGDESFYEGYSYEEYEPKEPAKTADEWKTRLEEMQESYGIDFEHLFAEMPPEEEWLQVISIVKDANNETEDSYRLFAALLEEDYDTARKIYVDSVKGEEVSSYTYKETLSRLTQLGVPFEEAKKTIKLKNSSSSMSGNMNKDWQRLLARGEIDKALTWLKNENEWKKVYRIGKLYERDDLVKVAIDGMKRKANFYDLDDYLETLIKEDMYEEVIEFSETVLPEANEEDLDGYKYILPSYYYAVGKKDGGAELLEKLKGLPEYGIDSKEKYLNFITGYNSTQMQLFIAQSLRENGKKDEAVAFLKNVIIRNGGHDLLYKEFIENYKNEVSFLDELMEWNPYQERPLIWKGHYLLEKGDLDAAEEAVKRAITLDPSDGEQGKETRMEVYNVLSLIHAERGNEKEAKFYADVMNAIRAGEVADDFLYLGLKQEAIKRYKMALGYFENAYCLQSRLAKTLLEEGQVKEAIVHFEKAFKLMPVSFGPVESHCFGCEGIFDSEEAQEVAERVFAAVVEESPENPRTYYLIATLYEEQRKVWEAFPYYLKAFERDPHYYNCAKKLHTFILIKPELSEEHPNLIQQIMDSYPYTDLGEVFENRIDLKQVWKDAQVLADTRELPMQLPSIVPPFELSEQPDEVSFSDKLENAAYDGWEAHELIRDNDFLRYDINNF